MQVDQHLYASEPYLSRMGEPAGVHDLDRHDFVAYGPRHLAPIPNLNWPLTLGLKSGDKPREPVIEANTINGMMKAAEAGLGLAGLPDYVARENERLKRVLPDQAGPPFEVYMLYPQELRGSRRVAAFSEFLSEEVKRWEA